LGQYTGEHTTRSTILARREAISEPWWLGTREKTKAKKKKKKRTREKTEEEEEELFV